MFYTVIVTIFFTSWWLDIPLTPDAIFYLLYSAYLSITVKIICYFDSILQFFANILQRIRNIFLKLQDDSGYKEFKNKVNMYKNNMSDSDQPFTENRNGNEAVTNLTNDYKDTYNKVKDNSTVKASTPNYNDSFFERHKTIITILGIFTLLLGFSYYMDLDATKDFFKTTYDFYKDLYVSVKNWISNLFTSDGKPDGSAGTGLNKDKHVGFKTGSTSASTSNSTSSTSTENSYFKKITSQVANNAITEFVNDVMEGIKGRGERYEPVNQPNTAIETTNVADTKGKAVAMERSDSLTRCR